MRAIYAVGSALLCAGPAHADEVHATAPRSEAPSRHLFYGELFGKGGLYGIGYELAITPRLSLGAAGSFAVVREQQLLTLAPYVHATIVRGVKNALFAELGAAFVHSRIPSPVDDWDGMTDSGGGGFASLGWERATQHVVFRTSGSVVAGEGGVTPWLGFAIGFRP
ncbi:MAG: hypothetical protein SFX73_18270 [Kofleriaceae bacterium]|nr:hypothetical protein [Kofleriaceae bacterium]